jgi:hypothetical protein
MISIPSGGPVPLRHLRTRPCLRLRPEDLAVFGSLGWRPAPSALPSATSAVNGSLDGPEPSSERMSAPPAGWRCVDLSQGSDSAPAAKKKPRHRWRGFGETEMFGRDQPQPVLKPQLEHV